VTERRRLLLCAGIVLLLCRHDVHLALCSASLASRGTEGSESAGLRSIPQLARSRWGRQRRVATCS